MTTETDLALTEGFDARNEAQWRAAIDKVLKGGDFTKRLVSMTADGIALQPLYMQATGTPPVVAARSATPWQIVQRMDHPDAVVANTQALEDLEGAASSLVLVFSESFTARGFGLRNGKVDQLQAALKGVALDMMALRVEAGSASMEAARDVAALIAESGVAPASCEIDFGVAPLAALMADGRLANDWSATSQELAGLVGELGDAGFAGPFVTCDVRPVSEAGGSEAQELGVAIASAIEYLRALEGQSMSLADAAGALSFTVPIDAGQFEGVAKLRALRKLWSRVLDASGLETKPARVHAETAWRMATERDAGVNMLRATLATFAAGVGGSDSLTVLPHTIAHGLPDSFSRRIARNTQNVLIEESNLWRVADPSAGAGGIEALTDELCVAAWSLFQEIEREGGLVASLEAGALQSRIAEVAAERGKRLASRREAITGTSEFPQLDEATAGVLDVAPEPRVQVTGGAVIVTPLPSVRTAEPFEALRDAADAHVKTAGKRPAVFLANLGPIADHTGRATWVRNLLAVGGIDVISNDGFTQSADVRKAFSESGATVACICSSDTNYELLGEAAAMALRGASASHVLLAGKPTDLLKAAGVDEFLHVGVDVLAVLKELHGKLGVAAE